MLTFGVFDWLDRNRDLSINELYRDRLALAALADELGFDIFHLAEHHGTPLGLAPSPNLFLAAVAQLTTRIRLCPLVNVIPLHNPLRLAEELVMLDQLSGGRLEAGVGKGSSPYETGFFGVNQDDLGSLFQEGFEIVDTALREGRVQVPSSGTDVFCDLSIEPVQQPIPMWYPTINPGSIPRIVENGFNTIFSFAFFAPSREDIAAAQRTYSELVSARSAPVSGGAGQDSARFGILHQIYVAETDEQALEQAIPALESNYESFVKLWLDNGNPRHPAQRDFYELHEQGLVLIGSPQTVGDKLAGIIEATGVNHFAGIFAFGNLPTAASRRSMELFASDVVPRLRDDMGHAG